MKKSLILLGMSLLAACGVQKTELPLLPEEAFQTTVDGKPVALYTLHAGDITMQVTNYGARVVSLWTPDREGRYEDIVLGYENIGRYIDNTGERFLGAVVGPYANRIAKGHFTLDGAEYTLPVNNQRADAARRAPGRRPRGMGRGIGLGRQTRAALPPSRRTGRVPGQPGYRDDLLAHARQRVPHRLQGHYRQTDRGQHVEPPVLLTSRAKATARCSTT